MELKNEQFNGKDLKYKHFDKSKLNKRGRYMWDSNEHANESSADENAGTDNSDRSEDSKVETVRPIRLRQNLMTRFDLLDSSESDAQTDNLQQLQRPLNSDDDSNNIIDHVIDNFGTAATATTAAVDNTNIDYEMSNDFVPIKNDNSDHDSEDDDERPPTPIFVAVKCEVMTDQFDSDMSDHVSDTKIDPWIHQSQTHDDGDNNHDNGRNDDGRDDDRRDDDGREIAWETVNSLLESDASIQTIDDQVKLLKIS